MVGTPALNKAEGSHEVAKPVELLSAAIPIRDWPPILLKNPPAYTVLPLTTIEETAPLADGFHAVAKPLMASRAAMLFLD